jgi:hypothetical protein
VKQMQSKERGIPILELDVDYGENASGQTKLRVEAFLEMLQNQTKAPAQAASKGPSPKQH